MAKKISILVVDDNEDFRILVETYLNKSDEFEVLDTAEDGLIALEKIIELQPDIILLDLIMPNLDGLGVLEKLRGIHFINKPMIVVLSAMGQDVLVRKALSYGVEYYFIKPIDIGHFINRLKNMYTEKNYLTDNIENYIEKKSEFSGNINISDGNYDTIEVDVTKLLCEAGVSPHMVGYRYLKEAIIYTYNLQKPFSSVTKELYPAVAEKFDTTSNKVDRAIRNCIEKAWLRTSDDAIDSLLGYSSNNSKIKPTNSEFIATMTERLRMVRNR